MCFLLIPCVRDTHQSVIGKMICCLQFVLKYCQLHGGEEYRERQDSYKMGHELFIVEAERWAHGDSFHCPLYFCICLKMSIIKSYQQLG